VAFTDVCLKRHILLLGWSDKCQEIIDNLHSEDVEDPRQVVIVTTKPVCLDPARVTNRGVVVVPGDPSDENVLHMANAERASAGIIIAEERDPSEADTKALLVALTLREVAPWIYIAAEVVQLADVDQFGTVAACVDEVVCAEQFVSRMLAQGAVFPGSGVVELYSHLLGQSADSNEVYLVEVPDDFAGRSYAEVQQLVLDGASSEPVILLGYLKADAEDGDGLVISPGAHGSRELDYKLDGADHIVAISQTRPRLANWAE